MRHRFIAGVEAELLKRLRSRGSLSRVELARELKLAPATAGFYVDRLITGGFLFERHKTVRHQGRPPRLLVLNPDGGRFVGVEFTTECARATAVDFSQKPLREIRQPLSGPLDAATVIDRIENMIEEVTAGDSRTVLGIGIGVPGSVDADRGVAAHCEGISHWRNVPLAERFSHRFGVPVCIENNIRLMALAELWFGHGRGVDNFICLGIGHTIGLGIVIGGELYRGSQNAAGDICSWPCSASPYNSAFVRLDDSVCTSALLKATAAVAEKCGRADFATLVRLSHQRDPSILRCLDGVAHTLAIVVAQLTRAFNPDRVVFAGPVADLGAPFLQAVETAIQEYSAGWEWDLPQVVASELGEHNAALGAAALAFQQWTPLR